MKVLVILVVLAGCGRLGFDGSDPPPFDIDAPPSPPGECPNDTVETKVGSGVCIEKVQRGSKAWVDARGACIEVGRRLCADAEWAEGCNEAVGVEAMTGDDWEWVAEEVGGVAQKRGVAACEDTSSHEITTDPYGFRCCVTK